LLTISSKRNTFGTDEDGADEGGVASDAEDASAGAEAVGGAGGGAGDGATAAPADRGEFDPRAERDLERMLDAMFTLALTSAPLESFVEQMSDIVLETRVQERVIRNVASVLQLTATRATSEQARIRRKLAMHRQAQGGRFTGHVSRLTMWFTKATAELGKLVLDCERPDGLSVPADFRPCSRHPLWQERI